MRNKGSCEAYFKFRSIYARSCRLQFLHPLPIFLSMRCVHLPPRPVVLCMSRWSGYSSQSSSPIYDQSLPVRLIAERAIPVHLLERLESFRQLSIPETLALCAIWTRKTFTC